MYEALELLLESRGSEDRRAEHHIKGAMKNLIGALEADLRAIDPKGNAALIERLDRQAIKLNIRAAELNNLGALLDGLVV